MTHRISMCLLAGLLGAMAPGCWAGPRRLAYDDVVAPADRAARRAPPEDLAAVEAQLAQETRLDLLLRLAGARNPELLEADERIRAELARAAAAGRLPDPESKAEIWGAPLSRPYALDQANALMIGVRQSFPAFGSRDALARAAQAEARIAGERLRARSLDVEREVRRAYFEYLLAAREQAVRVEQVELTRQVLDLARAHYQANRGKQEDVLRVAVELSALQIDLIDLEGRQRVAKARLNALAGRAADAPLGPPADIELPPEAPDASALLRNALARRPELAAAAQRVNGMEASLDAARREARWPMLMVGADYMYMPEMDEPHAYAAMISISLPWLNARRDDEVAAAEGDLKAERWALEAARVTVGYEVEEALAGWRAAAASYETLSKDLLPQAQQALEAVRAGYAAGGGDAIGVVDALRSYLLVRLEQTRALARLADSAADVERAAGGSP